MYKVKSPKSKLHSSDKIIKKFPQDVQIRNSSDVFQDVRIQRKSMQSLSLPIYQLSQYSKESDVIQGKLEISGLECGIDDLEEIFGLVYDVEFKRVDRDLVKMKIRELIQDDEIYSFVDDYDLKDYLFEIVEDQSLESELSDELPEVISGYTGILSEHPNYHGGGGIKERILKTLGVKNLAKLLRKKGQKNFDFYMCKGREIWVSDNRSAKPEKDTGYDIIFDSKTSYKIVKCDS